jgi:lipoprotein signal peptidase
MWWVASHYLPNTIYNHRLPSVWIVIIQIMSVPLLLALIDGEMIVVGAALSFGGAFANTVGGMAFGAVADYIPVPTQSGWECNLADIFILSGFLWEVATLLWRVRASARERVRDRARDRRELAAGVHSG